MMPYTISLYRSSFLVKLHQSNILDHILLLHVFISHHDHINFKQFYFQCTKLYHIKYIESILLIIILHLDLSNIQKHFIILLHLDRTRKRWLYRFIVLYCMRYLSVSWHWLVKPRWVGRWGGPGVTLLIIAWVLMYVCEEEEEEEEEEEKEEEKVKLTIRPHTHIHTYTHFVIIHQAV